MRNSSAAVVGVSVIVNSSVWSGSTGCYTGIYPYSI
jgi:hypothetical protein